MSKVIVKCFTNIADETPAKVFEGNDYQGISDSPTEHRVVINPTHADPTKSLQMHVKSGERNPTDPLRFARVEVYELTDPDARDENYSLTYYADADGNTKPLDRPADLVVQQPDIPAREITAGTGNGAADADALNTKPVDDSIAPLTGADTSEAAIEAARKEAEDKEASELAAKEKASGLDDKI